MLGPGETPLQSRSFWTVKESLTKLPSRLFGSYGINENNFKRTLNVKFIIIILWFSSYVQPHNIRVFFCKKSFRFVGVMQRFSQPFDTPKWIITVISRSPYKINTFSNVKRSRVSRQSGIRFFIFLITYFIFNWKIWKKGFLYTNALD